MSFSFTGAGNGTYSASGVVPANQNAQVTTDWATGFRDVSENSFVLISVQPTSGGVFNQVLINIPRLTTGSATVDVNCDSSTDNCAELAFLVGTNATGSTFQFLCGLETGTLTISTMTNTRATGTFSGTGTCFDDEANETSFAVSNGNFDVAFVSTIPGNLLRAE